MLILAFVAVNAAQADKDIYQGRLLYHCEDADMTAEVRASDYNDTQGLDVVIPDKVEADGKTYTVTSIGDKAFPYPLQSITLPESLTDIGNNSFYRCESLQQLTIPDGVKNIGDNAFAESGLVSIALPQSVEHQGELLFFSCPNLERIEVKANTALPYGFCAQCPKLQSIVLPEGLEEIGGFSFYACSGLTAIDWPNSVNRLKYAAFAASGINTLSLPSNIERIGEYCFSETALESIDLSHMVVTSLDRCTFFACESLKEVTLPASLTPLEEGNFYSCPSLESVTSLSPVPPAAQPLSFDSTVKTSATLYVPDASLAAYQQAEVWKDFFAVKGLTASGVNPAVTTNDNTIGIYDLSGRRLHERSSGVNIVKMNNGMSRKYYRK